MTLSIIIISFNTRQLILDCLRSIYDTAADLNLEVIVVDNASTDDSPQAIKKSFPQVKLIQNQTNLGFTKANNQGIKTSRRECVMLLNSDTIVKPGALHTLVSYLDSHPQVGIVGPQLINPDDSIQPSGGYLPRLSNIIAWMLFIDDLPFIKPWFWSYQLRYLPKFHHTRLFGWLQGAALVLRRSTLDQIGSLDESIFMYAEDVELCFRAQKAGWLIYLVAEAQVIHLGFRSGSPETAILGEYQGLKYIFQKHKPTWELPILRFWLKLGSLLRLLIFGTILKDKSDYAIYRQAFSMA